VFSPPKPAYEIAEVIEDRRLLRKLRLLFWCIAIAFGFVQAWNNRLLMNSDGICYLDLADAYLRGGYRLLLNAHWSPLYPWLLGLAKRLVNPAPYWEFTLLHLVNFVIYVFALVAFEFR
jgi:CHASE2 domain-containing sensor protein